MGTIILDSALLAQGWANNVAVTIDDRGDIVEVSADSVDRTGKRVTGCLLPGVPNLHSHAHQRAMVGLAERSDGNADNFWTWREVMYGFLGGINPHHLGAIAAQLYIEMLKSGYTCVGEFQYLHHNKEGKPHDEPAEMSLRTLAAAREVGIGITNLPALYRYSDFGGQEPLPDQRRFINDAEDFLSILGTLIEAGGDDPNVATGVALHSLRAISKGLIEEVLEEIRGHRNRPIHIHIGEQIEEVEKCLAWSNQRPVEWLYSNCDVDERWCLIHATHMSEGEMAQVVQSGAVVGVCPTTEANLGDGLFDAVAYVRLNGCLGIGSDSNVSVSPVEELRWLEYGQRLTELKRNALAGPEQGSTARNLFELALAGGAQACGRKIGRIEAGYRADLIVLETDHPLLYHRSEDELLSSWIFAGNTNLVRDVYVGGKLVVENGKHLMEESIGSRFKHAIDELADKI